MKMAGRLRHWCLNPVVASDGLGGYSGGTGIEIKRWLLIFEGALPATLDWDPAGATGL